jgi:hypothetical protein
MYILLMVYKGQWHTRCNDGEWRVDPWYGTYGECMKTYKTIGSAKGAQTRIINNGWETASKRFWITQLREDDTCANLWQRIRKTSTKSLDVTQTGTTV